MGGDGPGPSFSPIRGAHDKDLETPIFVALANIPLDTIQHASVHPCLVVISPQTKSRCPTAPSHQVPLQGPCHEEGEAGLALATSAPLLLLCC